MQTYPKTRRAIKKRIRVKFPDSLPSFDEMDPAGFALWKMQRLLRLKTQKEIDIEIGRIQGIVYTLKNMFEWDELQAMIRLDLGTK